jgi:hypothetical protein
VELDADALRADDVRWFAVRSAPPPAVAVRPEAGLFLATAVSALVAEGRLEAARDGGAGVVTVAGAEAAGVRLPALLVAPRSDSTNTLAPAIETQARAGKACPMISSHKTADAIAAMRPSQ